MLNKFIVIAILLAIFALGVLAGAIIKGSSTVYYVQNSDPATNEFPNTPNCPDGWSLIESNVGYPPEQFAMYCQKQ